MKKKIVLGFCIVMACFCLTGFTTKNAAQAEAQSVHQETQLLADGATPYTAYTINEIIGANTRLMGFISAENHSWNQTDRLNLEIYTGDAGFGLSVTLKTRFYWGDNIIAPGDVIDFDLFVLGTDHHSKVLWCDHGGIPGKDSTGTSNKRFNCNFGVVWLHVESWDAVRDFKYVLNFDDGNKDTFDALVPNNIEYYKNNF